MLINRLERIGRTFHHAQRFRDIVRVFLQYGYEDVAHRLHLPSSLGLPTRHLGEEQAAIQQLSPPEKLRRACEELGSASIDQVHRARLVAGDDVVVKVQRPGIRKLIAADLEIVGYLAALMETHI